MSHEHKHNDANGEGNRDGADDNNSWNCGHEGPTDDPGIRELRERQKRNLWCTLLLAQGVPMVCAGDELSRTQQGNNNGYCQDNELSWLDWELDDRREQFLEFAARVAQLRRAHPNFRRRSFVEPGPGREAGPETVRWFRADGKPMGGADWEDGGWMRTLGMYLDGTAPEVRDRAGDPVQDDDFLLLLNAHAEPVKFKLPAEFAKKHWFIEVDTARPATGQEGPAALTSKTLVLNGRSCVVLRHER